MFEFLCLSITYAIDIKLLVGQICEYPPTVRAISKKCLEIALPQWKDTRRFFQLTVLRQLLSKLTWTSLFGNCSPTVGRHRFVPSPWRGTFRSECPHTGTSMERSRTLPKTPCSMAFPCSMIPIKILYFFIAPWPPMASSCPCLPLYKYHTLRRKNVTTMFSDCKNYIP